MRVCRREGLRSRARARCVCVCVCVCACVCVCVCNLGKEREGRRQQLPHLSCCALLRSLGLRLRRHAVAPGSHCGGLQSLRHCSRLQFQRHVIAAACNRSSLQLQRACNCSTLQLQHPPIEPDIFVAPASRAACYCRVL